MIVEGDVESMPPAGGCVVRTVIDDEGRRRFVAELPEGWSVAAGNRVQLDVDLDAVRATVVRVVGQSR